MCSSDLQPIPPHHGTGARSPRTSSISAAVFQTSPHLPLFTSEDTHDVILCAGSGEARADREPDAKTDCCVRELQAKLCSQKSMGLLDRFLPSATFS